MRLYIHERLEGLPPQEAFRRWLDEIAARAVAVPHVRGLVERGREVQGTRVRRSVHYALDVELPRLARNFLHEEALRFELVEAWDASCLACDWRMRSLGVPAESAAAGGAMHFLPEGLVVEGEVRLAREALPVLARPMARSIEQTVARALERGYRLLAAALRG